jgi:DNA-binding MarR family transcriptional regulator
MSRPLDAEADETRGMGFLMTEAARLFRREFDARAESIKLTRSQWLALMRIKRQEGLSQRELAEQMEIRPITLTRILDRLAAKGWVTRKPHPTDRRVRLLYLTRKSKPHTDAIRAIARGARQKAFKNIAQGDLQRMRELLQQVKDNLTRDGE